jgi:pimeloyl-ACP methyl ester carboxylesterase
MAEPAIDMQFVQTRGLRFEVAMAGSGDKLALLLHGFPESAYSWRYQIPLLARLGYRVWAPNLRGYGKSDRPLGVSEYELEKLEQDVADLIDASGAKSVLLVAHDWGAVIAWSFAMHRVRPIERLVIMNVPHPALIEQGLRTLRQLRRSWYVFFFQVPGLPERLLALGGYAGIGMIFRRSAVDKSRFPREVLDAYKRSAAEPGAVTAMINYYRALVRRRAALRARGFPTIEAPTLVVWGEQDIALGKELTYGTDKYAPNLTLRYLPRVSHWVQQEAPDTVNAMLEAWLTGKPVPEAS